MRRGVADRISWSDERFWLAVSTLPIYLVLSIMFGPENPFGIIVASAFSYYFGGKTGRDMELEVSMEE